MNTSGKSRTGYQRATIALLAALLIGLPAVADDTELYFGKSSPDAPAPLVMLTLDYRPNVANANYCGGEADCRSKMGDEIYDQLDPAVKGGSVTLFDSFQAVFKLVFKSDAFDGMKIGFMMSHADCLTGASCGSKSNGGYVLRGFELFQPGLLETGGDANKAKQELLDIFAGLPRDATGSTHPYQGVELFFEMYRYLAGLDVLNGHKGFADFESASTDRNLDHEFTVGGSGSGGGPPKCLFTTGGITGDNRACPNYVGAGATYSIADDSNYREISKVKGSCPAGTTPIGPKCYMRISSALTWDPSIERTGVTPARYKDPFEDGGESCSGVYSINMLFQVSGNDTHSNTEIAKPLDEQGLGYEPDSGGNGFPSIIAKLHNMDIRQGQAGTPQVGGKQALTSYFLVDKDNEKTNEYARNGGTNNAIKAMSDPRLLLKALQDIGKQINAVSSSFVAVTVPVNADNRVTSLPNLFVALFQVDETGKPYWPGNLKKLDIVTTTLLDGSKRLDVNDALGAAAFNPATGRLNDSALTLWTVPTAADVVAFDATKGEVTGKDGSSVRRGGAGHKIPGYISPGNVGLNNSGTGARQIFIESATVDGTLAAGNPMVALDASSTSAQRSDPAIQNLLGISDTTGTATCPGRESITNYCLTFINQVLAAANAASGVTTSAAKAERATQMFLKWIRGYDVFNEAAASTAPVGTTTTVQRKWMMGDVLHSRPLAVNYGARTGYSEDNQDVRLIFGSNDGLLRMVRNTSPGDPKPSAVAEQSAAYGQEVWAFMPRELLAHVPELAMNFANVGLNRPYGVDGQPTLLTIDTNGDGIIDNDGSCTVGADDCDRAWVYFGLRRGGKSYYAVDISSPQATTPNLLWKIDESMADFTELGMTFSSPRVGWVRFEDVGGLNLFDLGDGEVNVPVPVVIFGGGYHGHAVTSGDHHQSGTGGPSKDTILGTPFTGADTDEGNAIFIVHARSGELIWKATPGSGGATATNYQSPSMEHGIAAPVSPMDADGDGVLDRLYVADTGGRVWRVDLPEFVPGISSDTHREDTWKATVLADLRPADLSATPNDDLRFFHGATLVRRARDGIGVHDAIAVGSGDREHPQSETNKDNWFFLLKDRITISGDTAVATRTPYVPADLRDVTDACFTGSGSPTCSDGDLAKGWRLALEETGEKNLSEPFIGGNGIIFTTYLPQGTGPDDAQCVPLGASRLYQVSLETGAPLRFLHDVVGDTFIKDHRWIDLYSGIDGGVVAVSPDFWITSTGKSGKNPPQKPIRFYWRESGVDAVK